MTRVTALLAVALAGCSHLTLDTQWAAAETLKYDAAKYPDDPAVVLYAEDGRVIAKGGADDAFTQQLVHRVYAIQNEKGFALAEVRIPLYAKQKLLGLKARHTLPDGTVRELLPNELIVDESDSTDGKAINGRLFRFPNVAVGSVLEWVYVVELPYIDTDDESESFGEYPVRRYEAWIEASKEIILEGRFYNVPAQAKAGPGRDERFMRIALSVRDVPARPKREDFAADWTYTQPRWAYRMLRWNFSGRRTPVLETWNDVIARWGRRCWATDKDALLHDFAEKLDVSDCADVRCRVDRAVAWVREHTEYSGIGTFRGMRKGSEIVSSREATSFERGLVLRRLLEDAGVKTSLAAYTARDTEQLDSQFPNLERLNRLLVYVPVQAGFKDALWVDPACGHCALGHVSDEAGRAKAIVFRALILPIGEPVYESEDRVVSAPAAPDPTRVVTYNVTLAPSGDATVEVSEERSGRWAANRCADLRTKTALALKDATARELRQVAATAQLVSLEPPECNPREGRAVEHRTLRLPAHAVTDGDRLYLPLTVIDPDWADTFSEEQRLQPVAISGSSRQTEYRVKLKAPAGWVVSTPARTERATAPGMTVTFETKPSPDGAEARLALAFEEGMHPASDYPAYRKVGEFVRDARTRVLVLVKR